MPTAKPYLASWEQRLLASAIDCTALFIVMALVLALSESLGGPPPPFILAAITVAYVAYHSAALLHLPLSLGRTVVGITVISIRGNGGLTRAQAFARPIVRVVAAVIAMLLSDGNPRVLVLPVVLEIALIALTTWRQSMADLIVGTVVVNMPRPGPHKAPAVPMYSATDAEFGPRPRRRERVRRRGSQRWGTHPCALGRGARFRRLSGGGQPLIGAARELRHRLRQGRQ